MRRRPPADDAHPHLPLPRTRPARSSRVAPAIAVATLVRVTPETLVVQPIGATGPESYPRAGLVQRVEASRGEAESRSMLVQGVANAFLLGLVGYSRAERAERRQSTVRWAAAGALFGISIGAISPFEHWRRIRQ